MKLMATITTIAVACVLCLVVSPADTSDDTLEFFLAKSDLVVMGKIKNVPSVTEGEVGVPNHTCEFEVSDVLKGDKSLNAKTIVINIIRFERDEKDHHPLIQKDAECIVFLKRQPDGYSPPWATADFWFGIQYPSPWMARSLKRLAK